MSVERHEPDSPVYQFRWSNVDLKTFVQQRRDAVRAVRRKAAELTLQADAMETEAIQWETALDLVEEPSK